MTEINQAKRQQLEDARRRSQQKPRRSSQQALADEQQSEVTERAPNLYRVPQINVPEDLQGAAKLIQSELQKIEQSQSVLLTLWQKLQGQVAGADGVTFKKPVTFTQATTFDEDVRFITSDHVTLRTAGKSPSGNYVLFANWDGATETNHGYVGDGNGAINLWNYLSNEGITMIDALTGYGMQTRSRKCFYNDGTANTITWGMVNDVYQFPITSFLNGSVRGASGGGTQLTSNMNGAPTNCTYFAYPAASGVSGGSTHGGACLDIAALGYRYRAQMVFNYQNSGIVEWRSYDGDNDTWSGWYKLATTAALDEMRLQVKAEIYAELTKLNPGIVIPDSSPDTGGGSQ